MPRGRQGSVLARDQHDVDDEMQQRERNSLPSGRDIHQRHAPEAVTEAFSRALEVGAGIALLGLIATLVLMRRAAVAHACGAIGADVLAACLVGVNAMRSLLDAFGVQ